MVPSIIGGVMWISNVSSPGFKILDSVRDPITYSNADVIASLVGTSDALSAEYNMARDWEVLFAIYAGLFNFTITIPQIFMGLVGGVMVK